MKTYITFGQIHVHSVSGRTFDKDCIAVIEAPTKEEGRNKAFEIFNGVFHQSFAGDEFDHDKMMPFFPRGLIEV